MYIIHNEKVLTYIDYKPVYKGLNVTEFGEETSSPETHECKLSHRYNHILHFVIEGSGSFYRDGKTYPLSAGKAFVITPKNLTRYIADPGQSWTYCWIAFSGTDTDTLFRQCGLTEKTAVFDFEREDIAPLTEHLKILREDPPANLSVFALSVTAMSFEVLHRCAKKLCPEIPQERNLSTSIIDTAVAYMQANLHKHLNVSTLCKELSISRTYFSTLFEATLKQPPYQYLQNLRIQKASELLLRDKNLHIYEIAEMVGFSSTAQFCKTFVKTIGCSPSQFRVKYK